MIDTGGPNTFAASMWRSGSTHICQSLARALGWRPATTVGLHGEGWEQQNINVFSAQILFPYGYQVFHQHTWGSPQNVRILKAHNVPVLVIVRNVYDILVSLFDHIRTVDTRVVPGLLVPTSYFKEDSTDEEEYLWLANHVAPWLFQFYASWYEADIDKMRISYNGFYRDQTKGLKGVIDFLDQRPPDELALKQILSINNNKSVGVSGRGRDIPEDAKKVVQRIAESWGSGWMNKFEEAELL